MSKIVYNAIRTPDGTLLESRHQHDYKEYLDANGEVYMLDGGCSGYSRGSINIEKAERIVFTEDDPIEVIREYWSWGSYGKSGKEPLHYILLKDMSNEHIQAILDSGQQLRHNLLQRELKYRGVEYED